MEVSLPPEPAAPPPLQPALERLALVDLQAVPDDRDEGGDRWEDFSNGPNDSAGRDEVGHSGKVDATV